MEALSLCIGIGKEHDLDFDLYTLGYGSETSRYLMFPSGCFITDYMIERRAAKYKLLVNIFFKFTKSKLKLGISS